MAWLEEHRADRLEPRRLHEDGRSLLVVGVGHARPAVELPGGARVARYAAGRDYHNVVGKRLRKLARTLREQGLSATGRLQVDAGPLFERSHAVVAGLGFASKAANLLHPDHGPWFFLGALILEAEVPAEPPHPPAGSCGTCTACLDACPTDALLEPGVLDSRRCISYWTIEERGAVPHEIRESMEGWAFGCDICSEVCPWGREAPDASAAFGLHPALESGLESWLVGEGSTEEERQAAFAERWRGSPLQRPRRAGLARNAALALGHRPTPEGAEALSTALGTDPSGVVRGAAAWGLLNGYGESARHRALVADRARADPDEGVRADLRRSLERREGP